MHQHQIGSPAFNHIISLYSPPIMNGLKGTQIQPLTAKKDRKYPWLYILSPIQGVPKKCQGQTRQPQNLGFPDPDTGSSYVKNGLYFIKISQANQKLCHFVCSKVSPQLHVSVANTHCVRTNWCTKTR